MSAAEEQVGLRDWLRRRFREQRPVRITPYYGYGTPAAVRLTARVLRDPAIPPPEANDSAWENFLANIERLESDEIAGVTVRAELAGGIAEGISDEEGYLDLALTPAYPLTPGWHPVQLTSPTEGVDDAIGHVLVTSEGGIGIISDIDDTVLESAVTSPLRLARLLLLGNAHTRALFPGVAPFYHALRAGADGDARPVFYLSGSPWNLYDLLVDVFELHGMPAGPLLLRSLERDTLLPALRGQSSLSGHKITQITQIMTTYPEKRFVLIGDSSQKDPEVYAQVVRAHPGRIAAIYLRDVTGAGRDSQVWALAEEIAGFSIPVLYAGETLAFAEDAAARGLIDARALETIRSFGA